MLKASQPIGIFDSGVGGLTVASAIHQLLPQENLIYFGDTAHTPWGNQSKTAIQHYATRITQALLQHDCKAIVVACNTASAAALESVAEITNQKVLMFNVIDPVINHLLNNFQNHSVGLIGTKQTIKSQAYLHKLMQHTSNIVLKSMATPLFVPLIEEGLSDSAYVRQFIDYYLSNPMFKDISALILGCTHYPLIKQSIAQYFNHTVQIIDSASIVAQTVADQLRVQALLNTSLHSKQQFFVSSDSEFFSSTAKQFFPGEIKLQTYPLWDTVAKAF